MKRITTGSVTLKCWDLGGQPRFRSMWERYCRGVNAIVFVVDSADKDKLQLAKKELHSLVEKDLIHNIPLLVVGNKNDLEGCLSIEQLAEALDLGSIKDSTVTCYSISAKEANNLNSVLSWLISNKRRAAAPS